MLNTLGALLMLVGALLVSISSHGADMAQQQMIEPAGFKLITFLLKYPLAVAAVIGSFVGAAIFVSYQKKDRFKQFFINAAFSIVLAPGLFALSGITPTWDRWLALCVVLGLSSGIILRIWVDRRSQDVVKDALVHRLSRIIGGEGYRPRADAEEKAE